MKPIRDFRCFKSALPNLDGHSLPSGIANPSLTVPGDIAPAGRRKDTYHGGDILIYISLLLVL